MSGAFTKKTTTVRIDLIDLVSNFKFSIKLSLLYEIRASEVQQND